MKLKLSSLLLMALIAFTFTSCHIHVDGSDSDEGIDDGPRVTSTIKTKAFEKIVLNGAATIHYTQGDSLSVKVKGTKARIDKTRIESDGETLTIGGRVSGKNILSVLKLLDDNQNDGLEIYITSPDIISVDIEGAGEFDASSLIDTDTLSLEVNGTGDINLEKVVCDKMITNLQGTGEINVKEATVQESHNSVEGTGDCTLKILNARLVKCSLLGTGDMNINMKNCYRVEAELTGTGDIELSGDVSVCHDRVSGTGDIDKENLTCNK